MRIRLGPLGLYEEEDSVFSTSPSTTSLTTLPPTESNLTVWFLFKEYFLPVLTFISILISSSYFLHRLCRLFNLHFKYRRFRFIKRSAAEKANIRLRNSIIAMDPLRHRPTAVCRENPFDTDCFYDAKETIV